jgi:hypothetical protein
LLYASTLLQFHFYYGDFICWLGGNYTNCHRHWDTTFHSILKARIHNPSPGFPPADYPCGKRGCTKGVPVQGHFVCPTSTIAAQDRYDNHPAVKNNHDAVKAKFTKEEEKYFHIHLPRFLSYFIVGLMINQCNGPGKKAKVESASIALTAQTDQILLDHPIPQFQNRQRRIRMSAFPYYITAFAQFLWKIW